MARPANPLFIMTQYMPPDTVSEARRRSALPRSIAVVTDFARHHPLGMVGAVIIVLMILCAISAPIIAPHHPLDTDFAAQLSPPSADYWLGTDAFGRDLLSRLIYGSRTALLVGLTASFVGTTLGAIIGVTSAYFGGWIDLWSQRIVDIFLSFPIIIVALAVVSFLGTGIENVIIAITVPIIPNCARVIRSSALAIREMPYVDAARALGFHHSRIIFRHMLPNVMAPYLIMLTAFVSQAILMEASLSFLGLGVAEPTAAWGLMLKGAAVEFAETAPLLAILPGVAISLAVFGFNLFGDSLRDALDPKLRTV